MKKLRIILGFLFIIFLIMNINALHKNRKIQIMVDEFMANKILNESISTDEFRYYHVPRETSDFSDVFSGNDLRYPGSSGDFLVSLETPFPYIPFFGEYFGYFWGGHAALSYGRQTIDITGNFLRTDERTVMLRDNNYLTSTSLKSFIGLRIKDTNESDIKLANEFIYQQIGRPYNYSIFFNRKKSFYCTDLIYQAWNQKELSRRYDLNRDGFIVAVQDLVLSVDTEIFIYKYVDKNNVTHVYF